MSKIQAYAAYNATEILRPFEYEPREVSPKDVLIDILFCGVCHSDIHSAKDDWGGAQYPMVPGHEIIGIARQVGSDVKKFKAGDTVGVGVFVDSCRHCSECKEGLEQYCDSFVLTYNSINPKDGKMNYGGYAKSIVTDEAFVLSIPNGVDLASTAPLLCAGITVYSPLNHWGINSKTKVGIVGIGGLGHVAVKIAKAMGAHVTVFTTSPSKFDEAKKLGADEVVMSKDQQQMDSCANSLDFILNTVSVPHDLDQYLLLLKRDGTMVFVGLPDDKHPSPSIGNLVFKRRKMAGSLVGGIKETQEMLDFCAKHNITADIELIEMHEINEAFERVIKSDVKYRFVIDMKNFE